LDPKAQTTKRNEAGHVSLLEANSSLKGYQIAGGRIPILITLKKTSDLKPHEETVPDDLQRLVDALKDNPVLRHPIIADQRTGVILDGTHRFAAIQQLKCKFIPSALVDYQDPKITVERWFRLFAGPNVRNFENDLSQLAHEKVSHEECEDGLSKRRWYATVEKHTSCMAFPTQSRNPYEMVRDSYNIELKARKKKVTISYQDNNSSENKNPESMVMSVIKIDKAEVVETVARGYLFPPKSTRHLVPSRPLGAGVPLKWLQDSDFSKAQSRYLEFIQSRNIKRLPEGSRVGSRRYLEEVFLFE
jgi:L-serine kinase (ADP)